MWGREGRLPGNHLRGCPRGSTPPASTFSSSRMKRPPQRLSRPHDRARLMSRYRPYSRTERLELQGQLGLPLDFAASERGALLQNPARSKPRRSRLSPARVAKFEATRARRGIEKESCPKNSDGNKLRQGQHFELTPSLMTLINKVNAKRGTSANGSALPSPPPPGASPGQGRAHVRGRRPRCFPQIRWGATEGQPICPRCECSAIYAFKSRPIFKCKACDHQFSVTVRDDLRHRKLPIRDYLMAIAIFVNE